MSRRHPPIAWLLTTTIVACLSITSASCVGVIDLNDYGGAANELCELLEQCFGTDAYGGCREHVNQGLDNADADQRGNWLQGSGDDCLRDCTSAKACLDSVPVCHAPSAGCGQLEHCCGFTVSDVSCQEGRCCMGDGEFCTDDAECCTSCDTTTNTCGGAAPCANVGQPCSEDGACCSNNCLDDVCVEKCRAPNESCTDPGQCCSEICTGGVCRCGSTGDSCAFPEQCCNGQCNPQTGQCEDTVCGVVGEPCVVGCCSWLSCNNMSDQCCTNNLQGCGSDEECCGGRCLNQACCADFGTPCNDSGECCRGACSSNGACVCVPEGGSCDIDNDCCAGRICRDNLCVEDCAVAGCHSACEIGPPLSTQDGTSCNDSNANPECISDICSIAPDCCCKAWDALCVAHYNNLTKSSGSACYGGVCPTSL
jgi:hypothetical protein